MASILVVEDHPIFVQSLSRLLRNRGNYEVTVSRTAEVALQVLEQSGVDLVLIDISLPGRSGIWVLGRIRALKPDLPCLMLSGFATATYVEESLEAGARGYVLKDDVPGILDGIQAALEGKTYISEALRGAE